MKKALSIMLAICMIVSVTPIFTSAITYEQFDTVFSGFATMGFDHSVTSAITLSTQKIDAYPYYHYEAVAGDYNNSSHIISLKPKTIVPDDYPIVKMQYRTDSPAATVDVSIISPKGENWMSNHPAITADGEWHTITFDYNTITAAGSLYIPAEGEDDVTFRFKPFGSQSYTLEADTYFDIGYVAFFKTEDEASTFNHYNFEKFSYEYNVLTPEALFSYYGGSSGVSSTNFWRIDSDNSYVRYIAEPGTYGNNLIVSYTHDAFPLIERPYVKISYRTDSTTTSKLDLSMTSEKGENWAKSHPALVKNEQITELVYCINDLCGASNVEAPDENSNVILRLKPWGSQTVTLTKASYFDLLYVAFFETEEEANAFVYQGDSAYTFNFDINKISPNYNFASTATVRQYIDDADVRINEIKHTNNTIPYKANLTLSGITGAYAELEDTSELDLSLPAGKHEDGALSFNFAPYDVSLSSYPYVALSYQTEITTTAVATLKSDTGSSTATFQISSSTDTYKKAVIPLGSFENSETILAGSNISLTVAPLGSGAKTLVTARNFDIEYIGMFKTMAAANNFEYMGEKGANLTSNAVIYTAQLLDPARVPTGRMVFVAENGSSDISNDGSNPDDPISYSRFDSINSSLAQGTTVFFKRGSSFRITAAMQARNYITYTSYGVGDKPKFIASIDGTGADKWTATEYENVWVFNQTLSTLNNDVGNIRINDGELWGIKVSAKNYTDERVNNGNVFNGRTYIDSCTGTLENGKGVVNDLEFWHDYANGKLYLNCPDGNPGEVFDSIEIANKGHAIQGYTGTTIDNLYITGAGSHGVSMGTVKNIMISNLHLEWIGGSIQTLALSGTPVEGGTPTRFGNALEAYGGAENFTIKNCFSDQIYDCCFTVQNQQAVTFDSVFMYDNVARYSNSGLEVWQSGGITNNMHLYDNYTLFGGYGWSHQRPNKDGNFFYGGTGIRATTFTNNSVDNNINILASSTALLVSELGSVRYNFNNNVYIMGENLIYTKAPTNTEGYGAVGNIVYNYANIQNVVSRGTDENSTFYFIPTDKFNIGDDPYEVFSVNDNSVYDITTDVEKLILGVSDKYQINASVIPADAGNTEIYYSSEKPLIASVDQNGVITANYPGTATIKVISVESGVSAKITVTVINKTYAPSLWSKDTPGKEDSAINVLFVGDEFFTGDNTMPNSFEKAFYATAEVTAADGMTAASAVDALSNTTAECDLILISVGYNDYLAGTPLDDFKASLEQLFSLSHQNYPAATVAYITPYNLTSEQNSAGLTLADYVSTGANVAKTCLVNTADMFNNASTAFTLLDKNGNPGQLLTDYIDSSLRLTALGADTFVKDAAALLADAGAVKIYGDLEYAYHYTAEMMKDISSIQMHFTGPTLVTDSDTTYLRFTAQNGSTSSDGTSFQINFNDTRFAVKDYPVLKIVYRASAPSGSKMDINVGVLSEGSSTRMWSSTKHATVSDGEVTTLIFDLSENLNGGEKIKSLSDADDDSPLEYLRLKPFHIGYALTSDHYFDIESIGFYNSVEAAESGTITEDTLIRGDIDGDGSISTTDSVALSRYFAKWTGYTDIPLSVADIDLDGYVTTTDSVALSRYFAKWTGYTDLFD
ncbi:MAG: Ig-like domain-containing protein [Clostridia bacterium]|nr:Ig-like domain-containing protein [Clostridia bacterium]